jgi:hypothetical protein
VHPIEPPYRPLDTTAGLHGGPWKTAREEHVVLRLEALQFGFEDVQLAFEV